ncbi:MAG: DUF87 domain-containing protein [Bryobacterales bacterium]|nr:DUF87 domain-containing protein [Bryobacterales bacterium]
MTAVDNPRIIGHIVAIHGFRLKVELLPETRSALRATLDGVQVAVAINAYLSFSIGAGQIVVGIITDLEARESYDPSTGDELNLELMKPRRVAIVQLLGTVYEGVFNPGITILPTLDAAAEIGSPEILRIIFESPPRRNKPENYDGSDFDYELQIGFPTGQSTAKVHASYNDLFSRPLAIVGNTGSGKSFTVASVVQKAMKALKRKDREPHIFVLDINGEYGRAFLPKYGTYQRISDRIYLNGKEFGIPVWFLNAEEICSWLSAAEQTQEPVLKDWWAIAKGGVASSAASVSSFQNAISSIDQLLADLPGLKRKSAGSYCDAVVGHLERSHIDVSAFKKLFEEHRLQNQYNTEVVANQSEIFNAAESLRSVIKARISTTRTDDEQRIRTADSPLFISRAALSDPSLINRAVSKEDTFRVEAHLTTLKLRLKTRLDDRRWHTFLNYEDPEINVSDVERWLGRFGLGSKSGPNVSIVDLSMLSNEVLPYACSVVGRMLLDVRERLPASERYKHPWVLVLEEAHNYARPAWANEERGQRLARMTFERVAKEGRKFGLSLVIASQRPSEISPTIISQCANFISHRLQNPDDIDHFRRIIPIQARRLLDQVTILASGEAIVFGSAFHIPARVQFDRPDPGPFSQTAAPYYEWSKDKDPFPLAKAVQGWTPALSALPSTEAGEGCGLGDHEVSANRTVGDLDDEIPF